MGDAANTPTDAAERATAIHSVGVAPAASTSTPPAILATGMTRQSAWERFSKSVEHS